MWLWKSEKAAIIKQNLQLMKRLILPFLALFILFGFKGITTRTITGTIVDKTDGKGIQLASVRAMPSKNKVTTDNNGQFKLEINKNDKTFEVSYLGYKTQTITITKANHYEIRLEEDSHSLNEVVVVGYTAQLKRREVASSSSTLISAKEMRSQQGKAAGVVIRGHNSFQKDKPVHDTESYSAIKENGFLKANKNPLSTLSIDVDAASYSNMRRFINNGSLPPKDAVRIEEMINYFDYDYADPTGNDPVNIVTELAPAPWNSKHLLLHIGLKAKKIATPHLPASNLVFLIDVSGSMNDENKLPLLVSSLKLLTDQLREQDKVAIVVYAGSSGLVLPSTSGANKTTIKDALSRLSAGGSTAGGAGLALAYRVATENFIKEGNNRIILATDGDFNVGASSDAAMERLIEEKRKSGVFLTVLGYGMGNYKDSKMETLADKGNGNYAYIDNIMEAKKVLVNEFGGTLFTVAKDVKLQLEFNPSKVQAYRLIGYENRLLNDEDFNDDQKDAGDMGSGHTVTALYEIIPVGEKSEFIANVDELKYQKTKALASHNDEMLTIKLRYKEPSANKSKRLQKIVRYEAMSTNTSDNFRFSAAVAEFGMLLRQSEFKQTSCFEQVIDLANGAKGKDKEGYRTAFLKLVQSAKLMAKDLLNIADRNGDGEERNKR